MKKKIIPIALLSLGLVIGVGASVNYIVNRSIASEDGFNFSSSLETTYDKGETIEIPVGYIGEVRATSYVNYPSGKVSLNNRITLDEHGSYIVKYIAKVDGKTVIHDEKFSVKNPLLSFSGKSSTYKYVEENPITHRKGLNIALAQGETVTFNEPVNLNNYDDKNAPFYFTLSPTKEGTFDAGYMIMTLTDAYNPNNSCEIKMNLNEDPAYTCWQPALGKANNQIYKGWNYSGSAPILWYNNYGTYCEITPYNTWNTGTRTINDIFTKQKFGLWVDTNTNEMYFCYYSFLSSMVCSAMMIDLDDGSYQDEIFPGFATGEVYVSFRAGDYHAQNCNIQVLNVGEADLSKKYLEDTGASDIQLDKAYDENRKGIKGYSYPVVPCTIYDSYCGYINPKINVYYNYNREEGTYYTSSTDYQKEICVVNNRFDTALEGTYSIVYSCSDFSLNYVEKVINIDVVKETYPIGNILVNEDYLTSGEANNAFKLPKVISYEGGYGETSVEYQVVSDNDEAYVYGDETNGFYFIPKTAGNYSVNVTVKDMFNEKGIFKYTFEVKKQINAAFINEVELPKYLIAGATYVLPEYRGLDKNGNLNIASIKIKDGVGERDVVVGDNTVFAAGEDAKATITYYFGSNSRTYTLPIVTVKEEKSIQAERYFYTENLSKEKISTGVKISSVDHGNFEYINKLLTNAFKFKFIFESMESESAMITYSLVDSYNAREKITFGFNLSATGVDVYVNGKLSQRNFAPVLLGGESITVSYNAATRVLYVGDNSTFVLTKNSFGDEFYGFTSQQVYLSCEMTGQSSITIASIINQDFTSVSKTDNRAPSMIMIGEYGSLLRSKGDVIDIYSVIAGDVLSPYCKSTVTLEYDYKPVSALDGTSLSAAKADDYHSYQAKLNDYGTYTLTYVVTDWANRRYTYSLLFTVIDQVPPTIYLDGDVPKTASVGTVSIPSVKAVDNNGDECTIIETVTGPGGKIQYVTGKTSFIAYAAGTYVLTITAFDQSGNTNTKIYYIEVK